MQMTKGIKKKTSKDPGKMYIHLSFTSTVLFCLYRLIFTRENDLDINRNFYYVYTFKAQYIIIID